jgi:hypothetical protein
MTDSRPEPAPAAPGPDQPSSAQGWVWVWDRFLYASHAVAGTEPGTTTG